MIQVGGKISLIRVDGAARGAGEITTATIFSIGFRDIQKEELLFNDQNFQLRPLVRNGISSGSGLRHSVLAGSVAEQVRLSRE